MKKAFYMMAAAAIALSSCSSEETTDVAKSSAISFRSFVGFNSRGVEMSNEDGYKMSKMTVSAFDANGGEFFKNYEFADNSGVFESSQHPYWPNDGELTFVAYSPHSGEWSGNAPSLTNSGATISAFAPKNEIGDQLDVVFAKGSGSKSNNTANAVELNFEHILSQIKIVAKHSSDAYTYKIKGIRIASVCGSANYEYKFGENNKHNWTNFATANVVYQKEFAQPIDLSKDTPVDLTTKCNAGDKKGGAMLIPQTLAVWNGTDVAENTTEFTSFSGKAYISLLIQVKRGNTNIYPSAADQFGWAAVAIPVDANQTTASWVAGNKYIYTLDLTNGCGKVDPVDPGTGVNPGGTDPNKPKDPNKGEQIFGKEIKFTVQVVDWTDAFGGTNNGQIKM